MQYMSVKINDLQISKLDLFELVIYTKKNLQHRKYEYLLS